MVQPLWQSNCLLKKKSFSVAFKSFITIKFQVCVCVDWPLLPVRGQISLLTIKKTIFSQTFWHTRESSCSGLRFPIKMNMSLAGDPHLSSPALPDCANPSGIIMPPGHGNAFRIPLHWYSLHWFPRASGDIVNRTPKYSSAPSVLTWQNGIHRLDDPQGQQRTAQRRGHFSSQKVDIFLFLNFLTLMRRLFRITERSIRVECGHPWEL